MPVSIKNLRFSGPVRVVVTHLTAEAPGYGAVLLSLPAPPEIGLDVRIAGADVTKVPFFRDEVRQAAIVDPWVVATTMGPAPPCLLSVPLLLAC